MNVATGAKLGSTRAAHPGRDGGLRGWTALVPALFVLAAPVSISGQLFAAQAGTIEPFVYIAALWFLRRRPLWFGVVVLAAVVQHYMLSYRVVMDPSMLANAVSALNWTVPVSIW